jgi:hypothetical protein
MDNKKLSQLQQIRETILNPVSPDTKSTPRETRAAILRRNAYLALLLGSPIAASIFAALQPSAIHLGFVAAFCAACFLAVIRFFTRPPNSRRPRF